MNKNLTIITIAFAMLSASIVTAADWPQFRGSDRDGKTSETGLMKQWPEDGPKLLWAMKGIGKGFASISIAHGLIYTAGLQGKQGVIHAFDLDGNVVWKASYGPEWTKLFPGARTTPTIDSGRLFVISGTGNVLSFDAKTGKRLWSVAAFKKFDGQYNTLGITESPLVVEDMVICTPGGKIATIAALDAATGKTVWTCKIDEQKPACCSPVLICRGDRKIIVTMLEDYVVGVDARTGELLWKDPYADYQDKDSDINLVSPIYNDGMLYTTSGDNDGGAMFELSDDGTQVTRKWIDETLDCHHGGVVKIGNYVYGSNAKNIFTGNWVCLEWNTGKIMYEKKWRCKGSTIYADGKLYCYEEKDGNVALVNPSPNGFEIVSSFKVKLGNGRHLTQPAISDGTLYIRRGNTLMAYDIKDNNTYYSKK